MSTASAIARPLSASPTFGQWLQKGLDGFRSTAAATAPRAPAIRPQFTNRQEAEKLRALARDMMRIDPGSAADMYAAADRHEFGYRN